MCHPLSIHPKTPTTDLSEDQSTFGGFATLVHRGRLIGEDPEDENSLGQRLKVDAVMKGRGPWLCISGPAPQHMFRTQTDPVGPVVYYLGPDAFCKRILK